MLVHYNEPYSKLQYEGEVIGNPIYKDYSQTIVFVIKLRNGEFKQVNIDGCREIFKYSEEEK